MKIKNLKKYYRGTGKKRRNGKKNTKKKGKKHPQPIRNHIFETHESASSIAKWILEDGGKLAAK